MFFGAWRLLNRVNKVNVMSGFLAIAALVVIAFFAYRSFAIPKDSTEGAHPKSGSDHSGESYGLYSDDEEMDRLYTDQISVRFNRT